MKVRIPGFPSSVGISLGLPDIGELLMYPHFQGIGAEDFRKYATQYQKYLLDCLPLRNDRKNVLIRSGTWLLEPGTRSHVTGAGDWHVDGVTDHDHIQPLERVHLLSSPCQALTQFNTTPLEIDSDPNETRVQFSSRVRRNADAFGVVAQAIEPCRIYTFENHLHRAVEPERIELRYLLRVRETDVQPFTSEPLKTISLQEVVSRTNMPHMEYGPDGVFLRYPKRLR